MMDLDIYAHTIYASRFYNTKKSLELLKKILESNEILSRRQQGNMKSDNFCGLDYISLTDFRKRFITNGKDYNSYLQFVRFFPSITFPKEKLEVVEPIILDDQIRYYSNSIEFMKELGDSKEERYTDLPDEVQAKDRISLDNMNGFLLPVYEIMNFWKNNDKNRDNIKKEIELYKELFIKYGKEVPFYEPISCESLETDNDITRTIYALRLYNRK